MNVGTIHQILILYIFWGRDWNTKYNIVYVYVSEKRYSGVLGRNGYLVRNGGEF